MDQVHNQCGLTNCKLTAQVKENKIFSLISAWSVAAIPFDLQNYMTVSYKTVMGRDVAQLVERRNCTPLTQVQFPDAARDFSPSQPSVQMLLGCVSRQQV